MWNTTLPKLLIDQLGDLAPDCVAYAENEDALFLVFKSEQRRGQLRHLFGCGVVGECSSRDWPDHAIYSIPN